MVKTLNINEDGDLTIDKSGSLELANDLEGLRQKVVQKLQFFLGEWFIDVIDGTPYFQEILTKPIDVGLATSIINARIRTEPEVTGIGSVESTLDPITRKLTYRATIQSVHGDMEITL